MTEWKQKVEKNQLYQQLATCKLLPLYTATDLRYLPQVESVLVENELPFIEVTFSESAGLARHQTTCLLQGI